MQEVWKEIIGSEGYYEISNYGRIKSVQRTVTRFNGRITHNKTVNERILKPSISGNGYLFVVLMNNGNKKNVRIHIEVARHFLDGYKDGLVVHHKNHIKTCNFSWNLEYVSKQRNTREYYKSIGKSNGLIPYHMIPIIINQINNGAVIGLIAKHYNVRRNDIAVLSKVIDTGKELEFKA